ncbi:MAG TPA: bifunctional oligoribonuclease/PAP phosphatase NrnA [Clostridia bacterium]|nr:bifunctional oligoribonuclease/PAP phosphatase NrnA [Clostridia bacterium]
MKILDETASFIEKNDGFLLVSHISPDGDTMGSALALYAALKKLGKSAQLVCVDPVPQYLSFMHNSSEFRLPALAQPFNAVIFIDCADESRTGMPELFANRKPSLSIDHHRTNPMFADVNLVERRAATGELMYKVIRRIGAEIDRDMAECLFTAIATDSGNFAYAATEPDTFRISGDLLECGFDLPELNRRLFRTKRLSRVRVLGIVMSGMQIMCDGLFAMATLSNEQMDSVNASGVDCEGVIDMMRDVEGVETACLIRDDKDGELRVSMRSKHDFDVAKVMQMFDGGGHMRASGCVLKMKLEEAKSMLEEVIISEMKKQGIWTE